MGEEPHPIQFGEFIVDPEDRRLIGPGGPIRLGGRAFDVLCALLRADGRLVSKDQLFADVWNGLAVSDAALTSVIRELRIALGEDSKDGMIRAVYGKGYRLEPSTKKSCNNNAGSVISSGRTMPKLAVLPFDDLSPEGDLSYFVDGVSEEILSKIIRGSDVRTISKLSSFTFRGSDKARAGEELKATHVLDGSVRREGDRIRITAHLFEGTSGDTIWSDSFNGDLNDLFETQVAIAEAIATSLVSGFTPQPSQAIPPYLYDQFLRAKSLASAHDHQSIAIALMERVTQEAPDYAPGWGLLAVSIAHLRMVRPAEEWPTLTEQAQQAVAKARKLDPAEAYALWAEYRLCHPYGDYERQVALLKALGEVMGNTSEYHFMRAWFCCLIGRFEEAIEHASICRELNPIANVGGEFLSACLYYAGRLEEAVAINLADLQACPDNRFIAANLLSCAARLGDRELVEELLEPARQARYPFGDLQFLTRVARVELERDPRLNAQLVEAIRQQCVSKNCFDLMSASGLARYGSPKECHDLISQLPIGPAGGNAPDFLSNASFLVLLNPSPQVRYDPRFANLCARLGLAKFWTENEIWPDCAENDDLEYDFGKEVRRAAQVTQPEPFSRPD